jgi:uncharacterized heparinase superfamily protein
MSDGGGWAARRRRFLNRWHAWRCTHTRISPELVAMPEPPGLGDIDRGRALLQGRVQLGGRRLSLAKGQSPWQAPAPGAVMRRALHGFGWLDDLAALGTPAARALAQGWLQDWMARYGRGTGPGWTPAVTADRLTRMLGHAEMLTTGAGGCPPGPCLRLIGQQALFLSRRWSAAAPGVPRIAALAAVVEAGLTLRGMPPLVPPALQALARQCEEVIAEDGTIASRNPEELAEIFARLARLTAVLTEAGQHPAPAHELAQLRMAPVLRALRHADGGLARFNGGDRGAPGRLDAALAMARVRPGPLQPMAMGYARLSAARTTVIADAAPPPGGAAAHTAHAGTLAFELISGRRPLIVNCGSGLAFGADWARAARGTASHSTLDLPGIPSARFVSRKGGAPDEPLTEGPGRVGAVQGRGPEGTTLRMTHDGWRAGLGLVHRRELTLSADGRALSGADLLHAPEDADRARFHRMFTRAQRTGLPLALRFHLHPDVGADLTDDEIVILRLKSGEAWEFRFDGPGRLTLEPSVYLDPARAEPAPCWQIVVAATARDYETGIVWTLAKAQDTPSLIRDLDGQQGLSAGAV